MTSLDSQIRLDRQNSWVSTQPFDEDSQVDLFFSQSQASCVPQTPRLSQPFSTQDTDSRVPNIEVRRSQNRNLYVINGPEQVVPDVGEQTQVVFNDPGTL